MQADLFTYATTAAPLARKEHPNTSHSAAASVKKATKNESHRAVLELLRSVGRPLMTWEAQEELAHLPISPSRIRSAFPELERKGLIEVVGEGVTPFGRTARKWRTVR